MSTSEANDQPVDPKLINTKILPQSVQNIFIGLNKGNQAGAYELKESGQLAQDIEMVAIAIKYLIQNFDKIKHDK
jgi:hypothetical protein